MFVEELLLKNRTNYFIPSHNVKNKIKNYIYNKKLY